MLTTPDLPPETPATPRNVTAAAVAATPAQAQLNLDLVPALEVARLEGGRNGIREGSPTPETIGGDLELVSRGAGVGVGVGVVGGSSSRRRRESELDV